MACKGRSSTTSTVLFQLLFHQRKRRPMSSQTPTIVIGTSVVGDILNTVLLKRYIAFSIAISTYVILLRCAWFIASKALGIRLHTTSGLKGSAMYESGFHSASILGSYSINNFLLSFLLFILLLLVYTGRHFYSFDFYTTSSKLSVLFTSVHMTIYSVALIGPLTGYLFHWFFLSGTSVIIADIPSLHISLISGCVGLAIHLATFFETINSPLVNPTTKGDNAQLFSTLKSFLINDAVRTFKRAAIASVVTYMLHLLQYLAFCGNNNKSLLYFFTLNLVSKWSGDSQKYDDGESLNAILSDMANSVLRNEINLLCYRRSVRYLFLNIFGILLHSFIASYFIIVIYGAALQIFKSILFYPMDFSKAAAALARRGGLGIGKFSSSETILVDTIKIGVPVISSSTPIDNQFGASYDRQPMWQQIRSAQNAAAAELCKSSSGSLQAAPLLGCPVLKYLSSNNELRPPAIVWGQILALQDLSSLSSVSAVRRKQLFNNASTPALLSDLFSALCATVDAATIQLQLAVAHCLHVVIRLKMPPNSSSGSRADRGPSKTTLQAKADALFVNTEKGVTWAAEDLLKRSKALRAKSMICTLIDFIFSTPLLDTIFGPSLSVLTGEGAINDRPLSDLAVATAINSVSSLCNLLVSSSSEDSSGVSQHYVCSTIYSLLALESVLLDYSDVLRSYKLIDIALQPGKSKGKGLALLPRNLQMLAACVTDGIDAILSVHSDVLRMYSFPVAYVSLIQEKISSKCK